MASEQITLAVVGYGYWGPKIVRNAIERPEFDLWGLCELNPEKTAEFSARYPGVRTSPRFEEVLADPSVDAVSIATPPATHYSLVKQALAAGKHVLVEKPLATTAAEAEHLVELASDSDLVLMPGHTFLYSPAVNKVRQLIDSGELGEIYFVTSSRMNLGIYQPEGVICDLAPHDLSILLYWLDQPASIVAASGSTVFRNGVPETAFLTVSFEKGPTANVQLSWLAPRKVRQMIIVGSRRMVLYDDTASDDAIRVYDRGFDFAEPVDFGAYQLTYRSGDMVAPRLDPTEPLGLEFEDFARAIHTGATPRSHARLGVEIVRILEAAHESLTSSGAPVALDCAAQTPAASNGNGGSSGDGSRDFTMAQALPPDGHGLARGDNGRGAIA